MFKHVLVVILIFRPRDILSRFSGNWNSKRGESLQKNALIGNSDQLLVVHLNSERVLAHPLKWIIRTLNT